MCCLLCACGPKTAPVLLERPPLNLTEPNSIKMEPVKFVVIHKDNADAAFEKLESQKIEPVVFGLTGKDYKNLSINIQKLKTYILIQKTIIEKYKEYYEGVQNE